MKTFYNLFVFLFITLAFSCTKDISNSPTYDPAGSVAPKLSLEPKVSNLDQDRPNDLAMLITWKNAQYSFDAGVMYTLQIAQEDVNFEGAAERVMPSGQNFNVLLARELNQMVLTVGGVPGKLTKLVARLSAKALTDVGVSEKIATLYSNEILLEITPYAASKDVPPIYVPGGYQGWNPGNAPALFSPNADNIYQGYVYFNLDNTEFKIAKTPDWGNAIGDNVLKPESGIESAGKDDNFKLKGNKGAYLLTVDLNANTIKAEQINDWKGDPDNANIKTWGVIGNAIGGWGDTDDKELQFNYTNCLWEGSVNFTNANPEGEGNQYKFRANKGWNTNYGGLNDGGDLSLSGELKDGGNNFGIPEVGTYKVTLDFRNPEQFTYSLVKE